MATGSVLRLTVLAGSLAVASVATAETRRIDRPDGGPSLLESTVPREPPAADQPRPGTPAPRALDTTRAPAPDRQAPPADTQDARLAPPTPPAPQSTSGVKTGGGPARVKDIFTQPAR